MGKPQLKSSEENPDAIVWNPFGKEYNENVANKMTTIGEEKSKQLDLVTAYKELKNNVHVNQFERILDQFFLEHLVDLEEELEKDKGSFPNVQFGNEPNEIEMKDLNK